MKPWAVDQWGLSLFVGKHGILNPGQTFTNQMIIHASNIYINIFICICICIYIYIYVHPIFLTGASHTKPISPRRQPHIRHGLQFQLDASLLSSQAIGGLVGPRHGVASGKTCPATGETCGNHVGNHWKPRKNRLFLTIES
jgi:hypothetical protein